MFRFTSPSTQYCHGKLKIWKETIDPINSLAPANWPSLYNSIPQNYPSNGVQSFVEKISPNVSSKAIELPPRNLGMRWVFWVLIVTEGRAMFPELHAITNSLSQARLMSGALLCGTQYGKAKFSDPGSNGDCSKTLYRNGDISWDKGSVFEICIPSLFSPSPLWSTNFKTKHTPNLWPNNAYMVYGLKPW